MIVFQVFIKFWSNERIKENTTSHLYFNEESDCSEENTCEKKVFYATILHQRKKLNIFKSQLPMYYIHYWNRKSRLVQIPEAATGGVLWKKVLLKISQKSQKSTCARVSFSIKWQVSGNFLYRTTLKCVHCKNEAREIDCLCCREVNAMLLASAKIPDHEGSMSLSSFYGHLLDY